MSKTDEIKEDIGWLAQSYDNAAPLLLLLAVAIIAVCTFGIVYVNKKAYKKIKELGDL